MAQKKKAAWNADAQTRVHAAFQELYAALNDAYWAADSMQKKDRIKGVADSVFAVLTELNRGSIQARTQQYKELKTEVNESLKHIKQLQKEIDELIHAVKKATKIAKAIDQTVEIAAKLVV